MKTLIDSRYVRVTTVLSPFSGMDKVNPEVLLNACIRGTKVHLICDAIVEGMGYPEDREISGYIESFNKWCIGKQFVQKPERFYCNEYMITGELDLLYKNETGLTLVDLKTSRVESKTWILQGSAYSYMAKKENLNITKIEFVKLDKDGKEPKVFTYEEDFKLFLNCLETYNYFFKNKKEFCLYDYNDCACCVCNVCKEN